MKIENNINIENLTPASKQPNVDKKAQEEGAAKSGQTREKHQVSELARRLSEAKAVFDGLPEIRADRVALARARLLSGYYDTPEVKEVLVSKLASLVKDTGF